VLALAGTARRRARAAARAALNATAAICLEPFWRA
jgi:hypothetical protein